MAQQNIHIAEPKATMAMHPKKFALWLFIVSIIMLFAGLTSAYIVKQADGNWLTVKLPWVFGLTSLIIVLSSGSLHFAYLAAKKDAIERVKWMISITMMLGILFLAGQYYSWMELIRDNVYFVSNYASGSFIYIFTGLHAVHLLSGLLFLLITLISAFKSEIHAKKLVLLEMCMTYWHFLGGLWLYLYIFLIINS